MKSTGSLTLLLLGCAAATTLAATNPSPKEAQAPDQAANAPAPAGPAAAAPAAPDVPPAKPYVLPETVAVVEGQPIKKADLEAAFKSVLAAQKMSADSIPEAQRAQGYHIVLDDLIIERLITKRAADTKVTDAEVNAQWERIKGNFGSEAELKKQVEAAGETIEKVKTGLTERLRQEHWMDEQIKGKAEVTDADAEEFYKKNQDQFKSPEKVRASHILIQVSADAKPEQVVEKQKAAQAIADRVKKGEAFDKLAEQLSEDPSAKQNKGDLDFFAADAMVPEFSKAAFAMKTGEISDPVRSEFGYHIIKVTDRKPAETVPLEKAKPQLVAYLKQQKKQMEIEKVVQDIRSKADVKINLPDSQPAAPAAPAADATPAPAK